MDLIEDKVEVEEFRNHMGNIDKRERVVGKEHNSWEDMVKTMQTIRDAVS